MCKRSIHSFTVNIFEPILLRIIKLCGLGIQRAHFGLKHHRLGNLSCSEKIQKTLEAWCVDSGFKLECTSGNLQKVRYSLGRSFGAYGCSHSLGSALSYFRKLSSDSLAAAQVAIKES